MDHDAPRRTAREFLSRLRERRAALISDMAGSTLEGLEWLVLAAQLRAVQDALELRRGILYLSSLRPAVVNESRCIYVSAL
jgi:hypothetical protein